MKLVGFAQDETCNMTLYQRVRQQSMQLSVMDTREVAASATVARPVCQVNVGSGDTVTSTLSSAERTGDNTVGLSDVSGNSNNTNSDNTTAMRVAAT